MADPLSFVASIIAVGVLAGNVVTKGYRYIKAVKNCREDVRNLMVEVDVLCGILDRLVVLLQRSKIKPDLSKRFSEEVHFGIKDDPNSDSSDSGDEFEIFGRALETPSFVWECRKTLLKIEDILNKFGRKDPQPSDTSSRFSISGLRRLEVHDLKWPLSKSETLQLIETLERHKSTCMIALAKNGLLGVHTVLDEVRISNRHLVELRAKQGRLLELSTTQEEGAGKTILSTLVVDEVLKRKRSQSVGTAYFYIRHNDKASHKSSNVLGSIMSQLALQNSSALAFVMQLYAKHTSRDSLVTSIDDGDFVQHVHSLSQYFTETYIMIDGLDESGPIFDSNRKRLVEAVAELHHSRESPIRVLVFSRKEDDIRKKLETAGFRGVSVAATSADIRLFANAWIPFLDIQSERLKAEVVDVLVEKANGMFMWVRAQIDYLQRLPNDLEKRKALQELPPNLPQTYIRIFDIIDSTYPEQTTMYVQRALKWIVLGEELSYGHFSFFTGTAGTRDLEFDALCQAICIDNEREWPSVEAVPTQVQVLGWLGCLVREDHSRIGLSHFTVKEFLNMKPEKISSSRVQKYLLSPLDGDCITSCLKYITHDHFKDIMLLSRKEADCFRTENPLYEYLSWHFCPILHGMSNHRMGGDTGYLLRRFFTVEPNHSFLLWDTFNRWLSPSDSEDDDLYLQLEPRRHLWSPLQVACYAGLIDQVDTLLNEGGDLNLDESLTKSVLSSLHLAICSGHVTKRSFDKGFIELVYYDSMRYSNLRGPNQDKSLQVIEMLLESGASIDRQLRISPETPGYAIVTPLVLAILCRAWEIASLLLRRGAAWDARANIIPEDSDEDNYMDLCSVRKVPKFLPEAEETVRHIVTDTGHAGLQEILDSWEALRNENNLESVPSEVSRELLQDEVVNTQGLFFDAGNDNSRNLVQDRVDQSSLTNHNSNNDSGAKRAILYASTGPFELLHYLLKSKVDPNLVLPNSDCALTLAVRHNCIENVRLLLEYGANVNQVGPSGWTPLLDAVYYRNAIALQILIEAGANANASMDDGSNALLINSENEDYVVRSLLLGNGNSPNVPNNYGTLPLHMACGAGNHYYVKQLLYLSTEPSDIVNQNSLIYGYPLYQAAGNGFYDIVELLLNHGAIINQVGPGNVLGSALMAACAYGHGEVVRLLLSRGAATDVDGSRFLSAEGAARAFRKIATLDILAVHRNRTTAEANEERVHGVRGDLPTIICSDHSMGIGD